MCVYVFFLAFTPQIKASTSIRNDGVRPAVQQRRRLFYSEVVSRVGCYSLEYRRCAGVTHMTGVCIPDSQANVVSGWKMSTYSEL